MIIDRAVQPLDTLSVLNAIPGNHVILLPDAPTFTIIGATDSLLQTTYTTREQIIGKPLFDAFPDNATNEKATGVNNLRASLHYVIDHQEAHQLANQRFDIINPHTGAFECKVWAASNKPVLDADGNVQYIIHTTEDITESVRLQEENAFTEKQLHESECRFRYMMEQAPVPILLSRGEELVIENLNAPMLKAMNKPSFEEVLGKPIVEVLPELKGHEVLQIVKTVQKTGVPFRGEEVPTDVLINNQLQRFYFNYSYTPIIEGGIITGVLHVAIDITQQVLARMKVEESEALLQQMVQERTLALEHKNKELEQFAYAASHDMQEPLRKVATFSNFLLDSYSTQLDERGQNYLTKIGAAVKRMKTIIDDLLHYSHQVKAEQQFVPTDLTAIIEDIKADLDLVIERKGAVIETEPLPTVVGVPNQIRQLFFNLINNALKFSKPEVAPLIRVNAYSLTNEEIQKDSNLDPTRTYVLITVSDNGIGFDQEYALQIFSLFKRLHGRNEYEGTGIGLALCKRIAENHSGYICAESQAGEGASFKVLLPAN